MLNATAKLFVNIGPYISQGYNSKQYCKAKKALKRQYTVNGTVLCYIVLSYFTVIVSECMIFNSTFTIILKATVAIAMLFY
jgi:hypothetical protein